MVVKVIGQTATSRTNLLSVYRVHSGARAGAPNSKHTNAHTYACGSNVLVQFFAVLLKTYKSCKIQNKSVTVTLASLKLHVPPAREVVFVDSFLDVVSAVLALVVKEVCAFQLSDCVPRARVLTGATASVLYKGAVKMLLE